MSPRESLRPEGRFKPGSGHPKDSDELESILDELDRRITAAQERVRRETLMLENLVAARAKTVAQLRDVRREKADEEEAARQKSVLIVEPDESHLRFLANALHRAALAPLRSSSTCEALSVLERKDVDLILADIDLPDLDGIELARAVREDMGASGPPIVLITDAQERRHVALLADETIQGQLIKPVFRDQLLQLTESLLTDAPK